MAAVSDEERIARRLGRQQRRAEQRAQNLIRAKAMHKARLDSDLVRLVLAASGRAEASANRDINPEVYVGCSGWYYRHWAGSFYPVGVPSSRWFSHYQSRYNTVELNAPFYSWPTLATVRGWSRQITRRDFTYTIKVNELITHIKRFARTDTLVKDFGLIAKLLGTGSDASCFSCLPVSTTLRRACCAHSDSSIRASVTSSSSSSQLVE